MFVKQSPGFVLKASNWAVIHAGDIFAFCEFINALRWTLPCVFSQFNV